MIRLSHPARGVAHVTNARWDAMDATASGAQVQSQGEMNLVSGMRRADGRRLKLSSTKLAGWVRGPARALARRARTAKSCGPDAPRLASSRVEMHPAQPGSRCIVNPQGDGGKSVRLTGEITYKP